VTRLPYLETTTKRMWECDGVMMDEQRVMLTKVGGRRNVWLCLGMSRGNAWGILTLEIYVGPGLLFFFSLPGSDKRGWGIGTRGYGFNVLRSNETGWGNDLAPLFVKYPHPPQYCKNPCIALPAVKFLF
jgi:hypothetical protein